MSACVVQCLRKETDAGAMYQLILDSSVLSFDSIEETEKYLRKENYNYFVIDQNGSSFKYETNHPGSRWFVILNLVTQ